MDSAHAKDFSIKSNVFAKYSKPNQPIATTETSSQKPTKSSTRRTVFAI